MTDVRGESAVGNKLEFWFSGFRAAIIEVTAVNPDDLVRWRVVDGGARDWIGTEIEFKIFCDQNSATPTQEAAEVHVTLDRVGCRLWLSGGSQSQFPTNERGFNKPC